MKFLSLSYLCNNNSFKTYKHDFIAAKTVRPVNRRFKNVAENMLNLTFLNVETKLSMLKKSTNLSLAYTQEGLEIKNISKLISLLDYLQLQVHESYIDLCCLKNVNRNHMPFILKCLNFSLT